METRHVRIDYENALESKKQMLSSEINLLHVLNNIRTYKQLRKKEISIKSNLRTNISQLRSKLSLIESTFPERKIVGSKVIRLKKEIKTKEDKAKDRDFQNQLDEIKMKLSRLH